MQLRCNNKKASCWSADKTESLTGTNYEIKKRKQKQASRPACRRLFCKIYLQIIQPFLCMCVRACACVYSMLKRIG